MCSGDSISIGVLAALGGTARNTILAHKLFPRVRGLHLVLCEEVKWEGLVGGRHWWEGGNNWWMGGRDNGSEGRKETGEGWEGREETGEGVKERV